MKDKPHYSSNYTSYANWKNWDVDKFARYTQYQDSYFHAELRQCGFVNFEGFRCLEIGFGNGQFAAWAVDNGLIYHGVELIDELVSQGRSKGFNVSTSVEDLLIADNSLDIALHLMFLNTLPGLSWMSG